LVGSLVGCLLGCLVSDTCCVGKVQAFAIVYVGRANARMRSIWGSASRINAMDCNLPWS